MIVSNNINKQLSHPAHNFQFDLTLFRLNAFPYEKNEVWAHLRRCDDMPIKHVEGRWRRFFQWMDVDDRTDIVPTYVPDRIKGNRKRATTEKIYKLDHNRIKSVWFEAEAWKGSYRMSKSRIFLHSLLCYCMLAKKKKSDVNERRVIFCKMDFRRF